MRIGIFGGTFDPVHQGHMIVAEQVMTELDLGRVVFVPGGIPPHKEASSVRAARDRPSRHGRGGRRGERALSALTGWRSTPVVRCTASRP